MTCRWPKWLLLLLSLFPLTASAPTARGLPHDAYVWQQHWTPALAAAVDGAGDLVRAWRVLGARADRSGILRTIEPDWAALAASGRPVVLVVRLDGQLDHWDQAALRDAVLARVRAAPLPLAGLEVDHDCPTARLADYAALLADLRTGLPAAMALSITALPTWTGSPGLPAVLQPLTEIVLQVHAVQSPRAGLFAPAQARRWIDAFDRRTTRPFRVALPTYGTRVSWADDGRLLAVESERPTLAGGGSASELIAAPRDVAALLRDLQADPPAHLAGIAWFRLPTTEDRRTWSLATWRAVVQGRTPTAAATPEVVAGDLPGLHHVLLANDGEIDVTLPAAVTLPAGCAVADGANAYGLERTAGGLVLQRRQAGLLHGHARELIGWMRCDAAPEGLHVSP
ncbi:MAG: DUF3142 domain-containing protein [Acetobacteraceae bacterium]|nr:DUF3142 domain-containing protein [Acetobacteraceae bacterium]